MDQRTKAPPGRENGDRGANTDQRGDGGSRGADVSTIPRRADVPPLTGCPCGHLRDADCLRHRPLPIMVDWQVYTAEELGIVPHDREECRHCLQGVAG